MAFTRFKPCGCFIFFIKKSTSAVLNAWVTADHTNGMSTLKTTVKCRYLTTYHR